MRIEHTGKTRFLAEWITAQHHNKDGEWEPDRDEYTGAYRRTQQEAQVLAITESKKAGVVEWWRVAEEEVTTVDGCAPMWDTVRAWTGDWEGNAEESR